MSHILFTGGGTLGPVTPLLAVAEEWRKRDSEVAISWIGTPQGPERALVEAAKINFYSLRAPKFDRSRPWLLLLMPWQVACALLKSLFLLRRLRPSIVFTAGAYVSVPIAAAAWFIRIPVWVHQLDLVPGIANRLMAPLAKKISVTWSESLKKFSQRKTIMVGAMVRKTLLHGNREQGLSRYGFDPQKPTVFVMGGGTGAKTLNEAMKAIADQLSAKANIFHLTGKGKMPATLPTAANYVALEFLSEGLNDVYAAADIVIARAGMGTIAELAALGKAAILVPLPGTYQAANAAALVARESAEVLNNLTPEALQKMSEALLNDQERRQRLAHNIRSIFPLNADERIVHDALLLVR